MLSGSLYKKKKLVFYGQLAMTITAILVIVFRDYTLFTSPRFWAEEGGFWFSHAFSHDWFNTVFSAFFGYYPLFPIISTLLASRIVPLEYAPLITTIMAFCIQCTALMIVVWDKSILWDTPFKKVLMTMIILFAPSSAEIWLNTNGSQYYLTLISVLILLGDNAEGHLFKRYYYRILIAVAGLTGVLSCLLTPLFMIKAWQSRRREAFVHTGILVFCSVLQITIVWLWFNPDRSGLPDLPTAGIIIWVRNFLYPFSASLSAKCSRCILEIQNLWGKNIFSMVGYGVLVIEVVLLWFFSRRNAKDKKILLLGSYLLLSFFSTYFAIAGPGNRMLLDTSVGNRYYYVTNVMILAMIFFSTDWQSKMIKERICSGFLTVLLILGLLNGIYVFKNERLKKDSWPAWREEISIWRSNPSYRPKIWPTGWRVILERK